MLSHGLCTRQRLGVGAKVSGWCSCVESGICHPLYLSMVGIVHNTVKGFCHYTHMMQGRMVIRSDMAIGSEWQQWHSIGNWQ